jgi:hypothetical protein
VCASIRDFCPTFNGSLHVEFRDDRLSTDAGVVLLRELDDLGQLTEWLAAKLHDPRDPDRVVHPAVELLRTRLYLLAQGKKDEDDADTLRDDAAFRLAVSSRRGVAPLQTASVDEFGRKREPEGLASQPTLSRLQRWLSVDENRRLLRDALAEFAVRRILRENGGRKHQRLGIDVDSLPVEVYGQQPGSAYNGHYGQRIYHPLVASVAETGDLLDVVLREGNVGTAHESLDFILAILEKMQEAALTVFLRVDAGFPEDNLLSALERRNTRYVAREKNNPVLDRMAEPYVSRPTGRPGTRNPRIWFHEMMYRAKKWSRARRVVLVVQERPGELHLHHFWLLTNWTKKRKSGEALLEMYRERGTAEGHQGELMDVLDPTLSSSPRQKMTYRGRRPRRHTPEGDAFAQNAAAFLLNALAYELVHSGRALLAKVTREGWSLKRVRERALCIGARITTHSGQITMVISRIGQEAWQCLRSALPELKQATT